MNRMQKEYIFYIDERINADRKEIARLRDERSKLMEDLIEAHELNIKLLLEKRKEQYCLKVVWRNNLVVQ